MKRGVWLLGAWLAAVVQAAPAPQSPEELLDAEQAFAFSARLQGGERIVAEWQVADGYYLYRDKVRFELDGAGVTLGVPQLPAGERLRDEFFGEVETWRGRVRVEIPLRHALTAPRTVTLKAHSQGCADLGVCYVPQVQQASLTVPAVAITKPASAPTAVVAATVTAPGPVPAASALPPAPAQSGLFGRLRESLGLGGAPEFLEPDQAYRLGVDQSGAELRVRFDIEPGYYLYRDKFRVQLLAPEGVTLGAPQVPPGKVKDDAYFGRMEVHYDVVELRVPVTGAAAGQTLTVAVHYQGCADAGLCYPPQRREASVAWSQPVAGGMAGAGGGPVQSEQDRLATLLAGGQWLVILPLFFGLGLLLAFTPCVLPMVPILSGILVGQGQVTRRRGFLLSLAYVLAMAVTYTLAGVFAGLVGANLAAAFQQPWILAAFSAVFVLLALSMFGLYELQLPSAWQTRLSELANRQRGGQYAGVAIMGVLSALIVGPCVAAPLAGALIYIGQTGDAVLGGAALFAMSLGMGMPLLLIGASAGTLLPKAGAWMDTVKAVFGVLLLAVAVWMLERILPAAVTLVLWGALAIVCAVYLRALDGLPDGAGGWRRLWKGVGWLLLVWGVLLLVGAAAGGRDPLQPLAGLRGAVGGAEAPAEHLAFRRFKTRADLERVVAESAGRPVMVDFYADWCVACKELERYTFSDPAVQAELRSADYVLLQADVTANDADDQALQKGLGIIGPPTLLFYGPDGQERRGARLVGFLEAEGFVAHLRGLGSS